MADQIKPKFKNLAEFQAAQRELELEKAYWEALTQNQKTLDDFLAKNGWTLETFGLIRESDLESLGYTKVSQQSEPDTKKEKTAKVDKAPTIPKYKVKCRDGVTRYYTAGKPDWVKEFGFLGEDNKVKTSSMEAVKPEDHSAAAAWASGSDPWNPKNRAAAKLAAKK